MSDKDEECRLMYKTVIEDLKFSKKQQWQTIYVTLTAIGAIVYVYTTIKRNECYSETVLFWIGSVILYVAGLFGITLMRMQHLSILWYRQKKDKYLAFLDKEVQCIEKGHSNEDRASSNADAGLFFWGFTIAVFIAIGLGVWAMRSDMTEANKVNSGLLVMIWIMGLLLGIFLTTVIARKLSKL